MQRQEPKLETHKDGVNFVMEIFRSMGGTVLPPKRPHHIPKYTPLTVARDDFMMDFENACLEYNWHTQPQLCDGGVLNGLSFYWNKPHPKGPKRHEDPEWAKMIQSQVYPHHSDVDWEEYVEWVSAGHGDEWFQAEEAEAEDDEDEADDEDDADDENEDIFREEQAFLPGYHEAQTRLRTAYLCKDMVRPLSTPLDDRITALALTINEQR
jgi:hypothetical protein